MTRAIGCFVNEALAAAHPDACEVDRARSMLHAAFIVIEFCPIPAFPLVTTIYILPDHCSSSLR